MAQRLGCQREISDMTNHLLKVIFRFFLRNRFFTILNITGFSTGLACCIVIYLFVTHEMSFDKFHKAGDSIYRVIRQSQMNGESYNIGITSGPFAEALQQDFPNQIAGTTRALSFSSLVQHEQHSFIEERMMLADRNFFDFFSFPLENGNAATVLDKANNIVVSKAFASKYFGGQDPIGKSIRVDNEHDLVVTGILGEIPGYSHLQFDAVGSLDLINGEEWMKEWWNNSLNTYVMVHNAESVEYLNGAFPAFMDKYFGKDFARLGNRIGLTLEPLKEIYFNYDTRYERNVAHGDRRYIYIFITTGLVILLLAVINYINLATAQSTERAREVGVRKTLGSQRIGIIRQFIGESIILCTLAAGIALAVAQIFIPVLNSQLNLSIPDISEAPSLWIALLPIVLILAVLAGVYPAFVLSSFTPVKVLKGIVKGSGDFLLIRKGLITLQFTISAVMIIVSIFIGRQLKYMQEKDLGFLKEQVVLLDLNNSEIQDKQESLIRELQNHPNIVSVSSASGHPGGYHDASTVMVEGQSENLRMRTLFADEQYLESLGLKMAAGRYFSQEISSDTTNAVVLNETAIKGLGWTNEEAIGKRVMLVMFDSVYREIVGVVEDFHFTSLKQTIEPLIISCRKNNNNLIMKFSRNAASETLSSIENIWNSFNTGYPAQLSFLDDVLQRLYASEQSQGKIFSIFSMISILIASLGIFGLASYMSVQRRKEIGIRKILGGSVLQIGYLLMRDLLALVLVAMVFAIPVCYISLEKWSETFAYRVPLTFDVFMIGVLSILVLASAIVSYNAFKSAMSNPVKSLRSE
jgi:putative ABC transport system permease protein